MQTELTQLAIAAVVIAAILLLLRRASIKSRQRAPASVKERLGVEDQAPPARRERKRPRPEAAKPEPKPEPKPKPEPPPPAADEVAAYKSGLAKTRGGFVARLGKLFGKKQIDAETLDELEEV